MGLAESVKDAKKQTGRPCGMVAVRASLSVKERAVLNKMLADPNVGHSELAAGLTKEIGRKVTHQVVGIHRRGECSCDPH